jgi:uncharacterized protein YbaA (DUF1428 family)
MSYVSGFVLAVPTANREKYRKAAADAASYFRENGATHVMECWGENVPDGKVTSFPMAVKAKPEETVVFSWVEWPSKETADSTFAAMMKEPRFDPKTNPMPFDAERMIYGGFETLVEK